jgi:hypothetical protein
MSGQVETRPPHIINVLFLLIMGMGRTGQFHKAQWNGRHAGAIVVVVAATTAAGVHGWTKKKRGTSPRRLLGRHETTRSAARAWCRRCCGCWGSRCGGSGRGGGRTRHCGWKDDHVLLVYRGDDVRDREEWEGDVNNNTLWRLDSSLRAEVRSLALALA